MTQIHGRYTFFEMATQKGQILAAFAELIPRHWVRSVTVAPDGSAYIFEAKRNEFDETLALSAIIEGRNQRESAQMWAEKARDTAHDVWDRYKEQSDRDAKSRLVEIEAAQKAAAEQARTERAEQEQADAKRIADLLGSSAAVLAPPVQQPVATETVAPKGKGKGRKVPV